MQGYRDSAWEIVNVSDPNPMTLSGPPFCSTKNRRCLYDEDMNSDQIIHIQLVDETIDVSTVVKQAHRADCGAVLLFLGTTREWTGTARTTQLEYEAYREMAILELNRLANQALDSFEVKRIAITHRLGVVPLSEASIAIAVSSPHRKAAFLAGEWLIDRLKEDVPIWKKDFAGNGAASWIHPIERSQAT
jgi:molybdopterin synthase catalytic subunit